MEILLRNSSSWRLSLFRNDRADRCLFYFPFLLFIVVCLAVRSTVHWIDWRCGAWLVLLTTKHFEWRWGSYWLWIRLINDTGFLTILFALILLTLSKNRSSLDRYFIIYSCTDDTLSIVFFLASLLELSSSCVWSLFDTFQEFELICRRTFSSSTSTDTLDHEGLIVGDS